jgi:hypothetical protein
MCGRAMGDWPTPIIVAAIQRQGCLRFAGHGCHEYGARVWDGIVLWGATPLGQQRQSSSRRRRANCRGGRPEVQADPTGLEVEADELSAGRARCHRDPEFGRNVAQTARDLRFYRRGVRKIAEERAERADVAAR